MDGVKVTVRNRGMMVDGARQFEIDRKEWRALVHMKQNEFHAAIFAWLGVLWWLSPGVGWVAITCFWGKL